MCVVVAVAFGTGGGGGGPLWCCTAATVLILSSRTSIFDAANVPRRPVTSELGHVGMLKDDPRSLAFCFLPHHVDGVYGLHHRSTDPPLNNRLTFPPSSPPLNLSDHLENADSRRRVLRPGAPQDRS